MIGLILLLLIVVALAAGFGFAALVTWALSVFGVFAFSWTKAAAMWVVLIVVGSLFRRSE